MRRDLWTLPELASILDTLELAQRETPPGAYRRGYMDALYLLRVALGITDPPPEYVLTVEVHHAKPDR